MLIPSAYSWGISFAQNDYTLKQGESADIRLNIQNQVGGDKEIVISLGGDTEIAGIIDRKERYELPVGNNKEVFLRVLIPEKAKKEYHISVKFTATDTSEGIGIATAKTIKFNINVPDASLTKEEYENTITSEEREQEEASPVSKEKQEMIDNPGSDEQELKESAGIIVPKSAVPKKRFSWPKIALGVGGSLIAALAIMYLIGHIKTRKKSKWDDLL